MVLVLNAHLVVRALAEEMGDLDSILSQLPAGRFRIEIVVGSKNVRKVY